MLVSYTAFIILQTHATYNAYERDIAVVNIFFGKTTATGNFGCFLGNTKVYCSEYEKTLKMTNVDFLANIGGLFGLCMGFSIISFVEIIYWIVFKTAIN